MRSVALEASSRAVLTLVAMIVIVLIIFGTLRWETQTLGDVPHSVGIKHILQSAAFTAQVASLSIA